MNAAPKQPLDSATVRTLAVEFSVHPRSLEKALRGGIVRGLAGHRIRNGLEKHGLGHLAPQLFKVQMGVVADQPGVVVDDDSDDDETAIAV